MARTADQMAVEIMLAGGPRMQQHLTALQKAVQVQLGHVCPECGGTDTESNGESGSNESFRCNGCNAGWDAVPV